MTRSQTRPLWQDSRAEITWQAVRDFLIAVGWVAAMVMVWRRG